jgi:predicted DNA-binding protein
MSPKTFTGIRLDVELIEGLEALKERDGTPMAESIRRAIRHYLEAKGVMKAAPRRASTRRKA